MCLTEVEGGENEFVPQVQINQVNLDLKYTDHDYNTRAGNDSRILFPRVSALGIKFKYQCVKIWNELPHYIKDARYLGHLKKILLSYFLESY